MAVEVKVEVGKRAPMFTLTNQDGEKIALRDLTGQWVVVYFYPRDDTPGCTTEAIEFTRLLGEFEEQGATVIGISPDPSDRHKSFCNKHRLGVTLLSDPTRRVMTKYGAFGEKKLYGRKTEGVIRSTVLVDPRGKVAHHWPSVRAKGHAAKVLETLRDLIAES